MRAWSEQRLLQEERTFDSNHEYGPYSTYCVPNQRTLASVMDAWAKSRHSDAPEHVLQLLHKALEEEHETG